MDIVQKQNMAKLNGQMIGICDELDGFTEAIKKCIADDVDLPQPQVDRIRALNQQYNDTLQKMKEMSGQLEGFTPL